MTISDAMQWDAFLLGRTLPEIIAISDQWRARSKKIMDLLKQPQYDQVRVITLFQTITRRAFYLSDIYYRAINPAMLISDLTRNQQKDRLIQKYKLECLDRYGGCLSGTV